LLAGLGFRLSRRGFGMITIRFAGCACRYESIERMIESVLFRPASSGGLKVKYFRGIRSERDMRLGANSTISPYRRFTSVVAGSSAIALLAFPSSAWATPMPVVEKSAPTREGWDLTVRLDNEQINPVGSLSTSSFSREAFVTLSATGHIGGQGIRKIQAAVLTTGYELGCQTDVSDGVQMGGSISDSVSVGSNQGINGDVGGYVGGQAEGQGSGGSGGGQGGGSAGVNGGVNGDVGANLGFQEGNVVTPGGFIQTQLRPGAIIELPMGSVGLAEATAYTDVTDVHLKIDACGGPAMIRSWAKLKTRTDLGTSEVTVYGSPMGI
jgi:hypothetical protein